MEEYSNAGTEHTQHPNNNPMRNVSDGYAKKPRKRRRGGFWGFVRTVIVLLVLVVLALVALDFTAFAHNPANSPVYEAVQFARGLLSENALAVYDNIKAQFIQLWHAAVARFGA